MLSTEKLPLFQIQRYVREVRGSSLLKSRHKKKTLKDLYTTSDIKSKIIGNALAQIGATYCHALFGFQSKGHEIKWLVSALLKS